MAELTRRRTVDAPLELVWDVITDHALYAEVAPNLSTVEVVEGEGSSLVRRCVDTDGNEWTESCTRWRPGESFAVSVDVESSEFHRRLFRRFDGEWAVEEDPDGTTISIRFTYEPRYGPLGKLISWYFASRGPPIIESLFDNWEAVIEDRLDGEASHHRPSTGSADRGTNALYR